MRRSRASVFRWLKLPPVRVLQGKQHLYNLEFPPEYTVLLLSKIENREEAAQRILAMAIALPP